MPPSLSSPHICRPCLRRLAPPTPQTRAFTQSPARRKHGAVPTFQPTSSPSLDALLSTFRTNIFLPSHLIHAQKTLLYRPKNHALLTNPDEPATVRLGAEVHQLHPLDHMRDEPATAASFAKLLDLLREGDARDWVNLAPFLEGLKTAGRRLREGQFEKMVRRANEGGRQGVVLECARRVEGTGFRLGAVGVMREVMLGCVMRAQRDGWGEEGIREGERYARAFWGLLWDEKHRIARAGGEDVKRRAEVLGVVVEMVAAKIVRVGEGSVDELGGLVDSLVRCWRWVDLGVEEGGWRQANGMLLHWAPVWHGMVLARRVLGEESRLGRELGQKLEEVEGMLKSAKEVVVENAPESGSRRGLKMYEQLMSEGSM